MFADNTDDTIHDLQSGRTDAALVRADVIAHTDERGVINASEFKFLSAVGVLSHPKCQMIQKQGAILATNHSHAVPVHHGA